MVSPFFFRLTSAYADRSVNTMIAENAHEQPYIGQTRHIIAASRLPITRQQARDHQGSAAFCARNRNDISSLRPPPMRMRFVISSYFYISLAKVQQMPLMIFRLMEPSGNSNRLHRRVRFRGPHRQPRHARAILSLPTLQIRTKGGGRLWYRGRNCRVAASCRFTYYFILRQTIGGSVWRCNPAFALRNATRPLKGLWALVNSDFYPINLIILGPDFWLNSPARGLRQQKSLWQCRPLSDPALRQRIGPNRTFTARASGLAAVAR